MRVAEVPMHVSDNYQHHSIWNHYARRRRVILVGEEAEKFFSVLLSVNLSQAVCYLVADDHPTGGQGAGRDRQFDVEGAASVTLAKAGAEAVLWC